MLQAPFLKEISIDPEKVDRESFPFNSLKFLNENFKLDFENKITFLVGENGSGKSTLLEAIAAICGFHESGGTQNYHLYESTDQNKSQLKDAMRAKWLPKVSRGFFFRSESFFNLSTYIDTEADLRYYGGTAMHKQSHGEAFFSFFNNDFSKRHKMIYLMDEPEAALSPLRQISFLSMLKSWEDLGHAQVIIATHSPIILSYPNAQILQIKEGRLEKVAYEETEHYKITKSFLQNPDRYLREVLL